jgi:hypothetical protein
MDCWLGHGRLRYLSDFKDIEVDLCTIMTVSCCRCIFTPGDGLEILDVLLREDIKY